MLRHLRGCCNSVSGRESNWSQSSQRMNSQHLNVRRFLNLLRAGCTRVTLSTRCFLCPACRGRDRGANAVNPTHSTTLPLHRAELSPGWHRSCAAEPHIWHAAAWAALLRSGLARVLPSPAEAWAPGWAGSDLPVTLPGKITNPVDLEGANLHHSSFPPDPIPQTCFQESCSVQEPAKKFMVNPKALSHLHHLNDGGRCLLPSLLLSAQISASG